MYRWCMCVYESLVPVGSVNDVLMKGIEVVTGFLASVCLAG